MSPKTPGKDLKEKDKREDMVKMFHLYGVMEDIEGPDTAGDDVRGLGEALGSFRIFFLNQTTGSMVKNMAYGGQFWAPGPLN